MKLRASAALVGDFRSAIRPFNPWRRRLTAAALWVLIVTAATGGIVGLVRPDQVAEARLDAAPVDLPAGAAGFAELAVRAWMAATPEAPGELQT
ncbi:MAG: hypothetical protein ACRD0U_01110, partial [Acidimicrobiales bacterium]